MEAYGRLDHESFGGMVGELLFQSGRGDTLVIALCGRGQRPARFLSALKSSLRSSPSFLVLAPSTEWYPKPNSPDDQELAVAGAKLCARTLAKCLWDLEVQGSIDLGKTVLVGHSAGAVVALTLATNSPDGYLGVIAHKGCLLDPSAHTMARNSCPILMINSLDDDVFGIEARVRPTRQALEGRARLTSVELPTGGHEIGIDGLRLIDDFISLLSPEAACTSA